MVHPAAPFVLMPSDQAALQGWSRMGSLAQRLGQWASSAVIGGWINAQRRQPSPPGLSIGGVQMAKALSGGGS